jgi:hypothetical protein
VPALLPRTRCAGSVELIVSWLLNEAQRPSIGGQ